MPFLRRKKFGFRKSFKGKRFMYKKTMPMFRRRRFMKKYYGRMLGNPFSFKSRVDAVVKKEYKSFMGSFNGNIPVFASVSIQSIMNQILQGVGSFGRVGNRVDATALHLKISMYCQNIQATAIDDVRILVLKEFHPDTGATTFPISQLFQITGQNTTQYFMSVGTQKRWEILRDTGAVSIGFQSGLLAERTYSWHINLKNMQTRYSADSTDLSSIELNNLHILLWCYPSDTEEPPICNYVFRLRYTDM